MFDLHTHRYLPLFLLIFGQNVFAQTDTTAQLPIATPLVTDSLPPLDSARIDSMNLVLHPNFVNRFFTKNYPNPRKAAILSLILPGLGQAYNRKWWKIPVVYAVLGGIGYFEVRNINTYKLYKSSYRALVDGDPLTVVTDPRLILQDRVTMKSNRDIARKNLEQNSLILGLGYLLAVTDAFVDAHMYTFDVSDDLSLQFCPKAENISGFGASFGVGITLAIR